MIQKVPAEVEPEKLATTSPKPPSWIGRRTKSFSLSLLTLFGLAIFFYLNFHTVIVSGHSMEPTFQNGQRLLASKAYWLVGPIKHNDIVVISTGKPNEYIIKRVYRMGGETVDWINAPLSWKLVYGEFKVPEGSVYVIGDNRPISEDSRYFGPVPMSRILGKIIRLSSTIRF